jgi:hypothetical protein
MTDTEKKALALVNEVARELGWDQTKEIYAEGYTRNEALFRAIEQHEAFKQEVSKVMTYIKALYPTLPRNFNRFIIPAAKPDPLAEVVKGVTWYDNEITAKEIRAALDAAGFEIRGKNDG